MAAASGAAGGVWRQRNACGLLPGALLAVACYVSAGYPHALRSISNPFGAGVILIVAGSTFAGFGGARWRQRIDLPLDRRAVLALCGGFGLRGILTLLGTFPELRRISQWLV